MVTEFYYSQSSRGGEKQYGHNYTSHSLLGVGGGWGVELYKGQTVVLHSQLKQRRVTPRSQSYIIVTSQVGGRMIPRSQLYVSDNKGGEVIQSSQLY